MRRLALVAAIILSASPMAAAADGGTAAPPAAETPAAPPGDAAALAKKLANPVANLISVPFQNNYDCCYGTEGNGRYLLNFQPVIPISISKDWNLILRTIVPVINQGVTYPGTSNNFGFGDVTQSFFLSPKAPVHGIIVGVGPVFVYPLGNDQLGSRKWSAGGTFVVLKQQGPWTVGMLANHVWSFAGDAAKPEVNNTYVQPFVSYTMRDSTGFTLNTETNYNWQNHSWSVPINGQISHVYRFGSQLVSLAAGPRVWVTTPTGGPGWGARAVATLLFPKR